MRPILNDFLRDVLSITSLLVSLVGFPLTVVSLIYAIRQIREAKTAAVAAKEAANRTLLESESRIIRYALGNAHRFLAEARLYLESSVWKFASLRIGDIADLFSQLTKTNADFENLLTELRDWQVHLVRVEANKIKFATPKWQSFQARLQRIIDEVHGPFAPRSSEEEP